MKNLLAVLVFLCCLTTSYGQNEVIIYKDPGNRFEIGYTTSYWNFLYEAEVVRFYIVNYMTTPLEFKVKTTINWTCNRTSNGLVGNGSSTLYVKPNQKLFSWDRTQNTSSKDRNSCVRKKDGKETTIENVAIDIEFVKTNNGVNIADDPSITGTSTKCNKGLPQVLLSLDGDYFWKLKDGTYKLISKEQYDFLKNLPSDEEKTKWVHSCTYPIIKMKAKPVVD